MDQDVQNFVRECDVCSRAKWTPVGSAIPRISMKSAERPFQRVSMDYAGPFRQTSRGNKYFLVIVDDFSRFLRVYPTRDCSAATTIRCFQDLVANEGIPEEVLTDNGTHFTADIVKEFFESQKIKHIRSAPYHPSANGMAERSIRTMKNLIRADLLERMGSDGSWDQNLLKIQAGYNVAPHAVTGLPPFSLARGRTATPLWFPVPVRVTQVDVPWKYIQNKTDNKRLRDTYSSVVKRGGGGREFVVGESVWRKKNARWIEGIIKEVLYHGGYKLSDGSTGWDQ
jgi:hypothetical protein